MSHTYRAPALSPSRSNDFTQCPQLFRFRTVDKLPEPPSKAAAKGTMVHTVLEKLYDLPRGARSEDKALELIPQAVQSLKARTPELDSLFDSPREYEAWLAEARVLVGRYFTLEDPNRLEPSERESHVAAELENSMRIKGIVDRIDVAPNGAVRIVDYKTGKAPLPQYGASAAFQMRFYAVALYESRKILPKMLQLIYLGNGQVLNNEPTADDLARTRERIIGIWDDIRRAAERDEWRPKTSKLCDWCFFKPQCPAFGGVAPELQPGASARVWLEPPTLFEASDAEVSD
ncbi:RecB family exonuclease [Timonella sp. A28]|uniref:RecB family exonuclease n=1 Tax=Timonella sp. A28 TaxID=3442640 RepID=UPI003EBED424